MLFENINHNDVGTDFNYIQNVLTNFCCSVYVDGMRCPPRRRRRFRHESLQIINELTSFLHHVRPDC